MNYTLLSDQPSYMSHGHRRQMVQKYNERTLKKKKKQKKCEHQKIAVLSLIFTMRVMRVRNGLNGKQGNPDQTASGAV